VKTPPDLVKVPISEFRKGVRAYLSEKKPVILERNGDACAVVLSVKGMRYQDHSLKQAEYVRCLAELNTVFLVLSSAR
jgi:hypothetical protein